MTRRKKIAAALASAIVATGTYLATDTMPEPGVDTVGVTFQAKMHCGLAKKLAAQRSDVDCERGERPYVLVEVAADWTAAVDEGQVLPSGVRILKQSFKRAALTNPNRALTVLGNMGADRCLGGEVRRARGDGTYWTPEPWGQCCGEGCECAGARCAAVCPSHVYAGDTCAGRICRRWPTLKGCSE